MIDYKDIVKHYRLSNTGTLEKYYNGWRGQIGWYNKTAIPEYVSCYLCNSTGAIPLTKAQEYRIKELEAEIEHLHKELRAAFE